MEFSLSALVVAGEFCVVREEDEEENVFMGDLF